MRERLAQGAFRAQSYSKTATDAATEARLQAMTAEESSTAATSGVRPMAFGGYPFQGA